MLKSKARDVILPGRIMEASFEGYSIQYILTQMVDLRREKLPFWLVGARRDGTQIVTLRDVCEPCSCGRGSRPSSVCLNAKSGLRHYRAENRANVERGFGGSGG